jgi:hypothetical protein
MKVFAVFFVFIILYVCAVGGLVYLFASSMNSLGDGMAEVEKCQRVADLGFWECANKTQAELDALTSTTTPN